ncbi:BolA family transcriptional regulator [Erwinia sp. OLTSP20]|uniref:transcriptional regulator BolA n=1 Tax=unclassified Erwinia TaxID=2622719 RepID=UPI000C196C84|nr:MULTISPECIES: transcriptional regulator BolA [unclassified Erwinia]PIJ52277.1 BolA family transcriptional regulator [Erwinia sp. OAMSP11]PIJ75754.1 BolA family transcriptional regulator [Erwinia sp. OLSSP12]PIJ81157.1 BolA family transcriptional regulator [Erwinia sp. OLMTSP26]PIJ84310.1 BolA family transcriptional regulator [Erwinia sp. OLCASP19]PIJ88748.1 BolA family transcriptional regulator [Erwinia sp. OLMDSP33]
MMREHIETKLRAAFSPQHLQVIDESHRHNVPAGASSHFKIVLVSDQFINQRALQRHRAIYSLLAEELAAGVHALALHTYTGEEWQQRQNQAPASPDCCGAGTQA